MGDSLDKVIEIACDGGCRGNGKENNIGAWGFVARLGSKEKKVCGVEYNTTNNRMELSGFQKALEFVRNVQSTKIIIYLDSALVYNTFKQGWYRTWIRDGWVKKVSKEPVKNRDILEQIIPLFESKENLIELIKVKGHSDHELNISVDKEVNIAMDEALKK